MTSSEPTAGAAVLPLAIDIGPLKQFCEVNFWGDHRYRSIELQRLEFLDGRSGHVVAMWRTDDLLDLYAEPHLGLTEAWWDSEPALADIPRGSLIHTELDVASFITNPTECDTRVSFVDSTGRDVELHARSGGATRELFVPSVLRQRAKLLRLLYIFELGTLAPTDDVSVRFDGTPMKLNRWAWPLAARRHLQARYGDDLVLLAINAPGGAAIRADDQRLDVTTAGDAALGLCDQVGSHTIDVRFEPPLPLVDARNHSARAPHDGRFVVRIDDQFVTAGSIVVGPEQIIIDDVHQNWRPPGADVSVWALEVFRRVKAARRRWRWVGRLDRGTLEGAWERPANTSGDNQPDASTTSSTASA